MTSPNHLETWHHVACSPSQWIVLHRRRNRSDRTCLLPRLARSPILMLGHRLVNTSIGPVLRLDEIRVWSTALPPNTLWNRAAMGFTGMTTSYCATFSLEVRATTASLPQRHSPTQHGMDMIISTMLPLSMPNSWMALTSRTQVQEENCPLTFSPMMHH